MGHKSDLLVIQENKLELGKDVDIAKYIAGAVVVFDMRLRKVKWVQHLDLSTDHTQFRAYVYSAPTLVDLDADGKLEIIVGTSMVEYPHIPLFLPWLADIFDTMRQCIRHIIQMIEFLVRNKQQQ